MLSISHNGTPFPPPESTFPLQECKHFPKTVCVKDPVNVKKSIPKKVCFSVPVEKCNKIPVEFLKHIPKTVKKKGRPGCRLPVHMHQLKVLSRASL